MFVNTSTEYPEKEFDTEPSTRHFAQPRFHSRFSCVGQSRLVGQFSHFAVQNDGMRVYLLILIVFTLATANLPPGSSGGFPDLLGLETKETPPHD
ncbi:hypothetical protein NPIL_194851 [Nephila pilipes]|uniref:Uncharacterized protein n=1 Tax=Nephila pilipes TaxID=299642 RepID=A0A8X6U4U6_NEPPI|nr:hypothetical protein NPIL_194851 [Nephila pilipes]